MNRFAAFGLFFDALAGRRILVLTARRTEIASAMSCFTSRPEIAEHPGFKVRRTNGDECIEFRGAGRLGFHSVASSLRGFRADVVFIDDAADLMLDEGRRTELHADLGRVIASSPNGEIVRA